MNIAIIGTGHVAHVLGLKIKQCGHHIVQVAGRNPERVQQLASLLQSAAVSDFSALSGEADVYIIAVADHALADIQSWFPKQGRGIVVHTAGAVSIHLLSGIAVNFGVLYPLQSLRSNIPGIPDIPFLIDADSPGTLQTIRVFADSLSGKVMPADDDTRLKLHLGAAVVNNFSNHLFTLVQHYYTKENLNFALLMPLLRETVQRLEQAPARTLQTGPAVRNDQYTLAKHQLLLQDYPEVLEIYREISVSISRYHHPANT